MKIDLTPILQAVISLIAIIITYRLVPWLKSKLDGQEMENLHIAAKVAVFAAEQLFNTGVVTDRLNYAIARLQEQGWDLDPDTLRDAIESAVKELKITMTPTVSGELIESGAGELKTAPENE